MGTLVRRMEPGVMAGRPAMESNLELAEGELEGWEGGGKEQSRRRRKGNHGKGVWERAVKVAPFQRLGRLEKRPGHAPAAV